MDVWVVAAAAGAGYVVQHLKNLSKGKNQRLGLTLENLNNVAPQFPSIRHKICPFRRVLSRKSFGEERDQDFEASNSEYEDENLAMRDSIMSYRKIPDSSSLAPTVDEEDVQGDWEGRLPSDSREGFMSPLPPKREIKFLNDSRGKRSSLKSGKFNSEFIKPQTSLESCVMAQLYGECDDIEEYACHPLGKPVLRPFVVTDGSKIISTSLHESFCLPFGTGTGNCQVQMHGEDSQVQEIVYVAPRLSNAVPVELQKKAKTRDKHTHSRKGCCGDCDIAHGTSDKAILFNLGLMMGIVSSFFANKQEAQEMKCLLNKTESLVQDLQEELEMKDTLTVKELATEDHESLDAYTDHCVDDVHSLSLKEKFDEEYCSEKVEEKSLNEIEAELEAELQRLESSINSSSLEGKLCNLTGLDPESASVFHEDKLWSDSFAKTKNQFDADRDENCSSTPQSFHYAVSPRELSLHLHQVIQSRLEERVKELEMALRDNQRKIESMKSEDIHPWRELSNSITRTSSTHDSPIARDGLESLDQPVIINLSGEALAAYNEASEEFTKASESDDEDFQSRFENGYHVQNVCMDRHSGFNGNHNTVLDQITVQDLYSPENNIVCSSREEIEDGDQEEMERLLIRQIVEKAKQGSPAVLKAQRAFLLSNIENEH